MNGMLGIVRVTVASLAFGLAGTALAIDIEPRPVVVTLFDVPVEMPVRATLTFVDAPGQLTVGVKVLANLAGLQSNFLAIAGRLPLPSDNCERHGVNPVVDSIDQASLAVDGKNALVSLSGRVTLWGCAEVFGSDVKTELDSSDVRIDFVVSAASGEDGAVRLVLVGSPTASFGNDAAKALAALFSEKVKSLLGDALSSALDATEIALPAVDGASLKVVSAEFGAAGEQLTVTIEATASATSVGLGHIISGLVER